MYCTLPEDVAQHDAYVILVGRRSCILRSAPLASLSFKCLYLVNQSERHSQTIGNSSGSLRSSSIRTDDHGLLICFIRGSKSVPPFEVKTGQLEEETFEGGSASEIVKGLLLLYLQFGMLVWIYRFRIGRPYLLTYQYWLDSHLTVAYKLSTGMSW